MKNIYLLIMTLFILASINSCKRKCYDKANPDCEDYDPCYGKIVSGDFTINQYSSWPVDPRSPLPEYCDTILSNGASFKAVMVDADRYFWQIGNDTRGFTDNKAEILFDDYLKDTNNLMSSGSNYYKPISVRLNVYNNASRCIDNKDTFKTSSKNLIFARSSPWFGAFKGICNSDGITRIVSINRFMAKFDPLGNLPRISFVNLPNLLGKDTITLKSSEIPTVLTSFKFFWWDTGDDKIHKDLSGEFGIDGLNFCKIFIQPRSSGEDFIKIDYKYVASDGRVQWYSFSGTRLK